MPLIQFSVYFRDYLPKATSTEAPMA